jgi:hypothetical protein
MVINQTRHQPASLWKLIPFFGSVLFILLYLVAACYYPGGSQFNRSTKGFSWTHNYWCNLLNETAINGQPNAARPIALMALAVLCLALAVFWYLFPIQAGLEKKQTRAIQMAGVTAMSIALFLFTSFHDIIINVATLFGLVALGGTFVGLRRSGLRKLFWMGLFILVLIGLNNVLYYNSHLLFYLPVVQKFTFLYFLLWICCINVSLYQRLLKKQQWTNQPITGGQ